MITGDEGFELTQRAPHGFFVLWRFWESLGEQPWWSGVLQSGGDSHGIGAGVGQTQGETAMRDGGQHHPIGQASFKVQRMEQLLDSPGAQIQPHVLSYLVLNVGVGDQPQKVAGACLPIVGDDAERFGGQLGDAALCPGRDGYGCDVGNVRTKDRSEQRAIDAVVVP